jgi:hypothetical protein
MKTQINQKELIERLKMPLNAIQFLKRNNTLKSKKVGRECFFDVKSVEEFERSFNMEDYLTVSECKAKLEKLHYYTIKERGRRWFSNNLGIYITVKRLIDGDGGNQIPNEYRLDAKGFGVAKYISRKSFADTLRWLRNIDRRLHPIEKTEFEGIDYRLSPMALSLMKYRSLKYAAFRRNPYLLRKKILSEL